MLALLVVREYERPMTVLAQSDLSNIYIEPGYLTLRGPDG
jgi:hypothetical protein